MAEKRRIKKERDMGFIVGNWILFAVIYGQKKTWLTAVL